MREGWPSVTAAAVSVARGVGVSGVSRDPWAERLLPRPLSALVRASRMPGAGPLLRLASLGTVDHLALRTSAIDAALLESRCEQLVILGAGLDARALRLPELAGVPVFEVDHPDTQRAKRGALAHAPPSLHFVGVDFARDDLNAELEQAGHDITRSTFYVWEGVTMYLPAAAARETMRVAGARSSAGSVIGFTYMVPEVLPGLPPPLLPTIRLGFRALGEALVGAMSRVQARELVEEAGFELQRDSSNQDWARDLGRSGLFSAFYRGERLCVARRP